MKGREGKGRKDPRNYCAPSIFTAQCLTRMHNKNKVKKAIEYSAVTNFSA